jgi:hypothetical protein
MMKNTFFFVSAFSFSPRKQNLPIAGDPAQGVVGSYA